jgi:molybdate transport system substrate-binding protein
VLAERRSVADVAILPPEQIERLEDDDKIFEDSSTPVAKLEIGVIVRKGAAKPDIRTVRALQQTLMAARSIASGDPGISESGAYFANLIERLRIAEPIRPKIKSFPSGTAAIANGDADIGVGMVSMVDQCCP